MKKYDYADAKAWGLLVNAGPLSERVEATDYKRACAQLYDAFMIIINDVRERYEHALTENKELSELTKTHCNKKRNAYCYFKNRLIEQFDDAVSDDLRFDAFYELYQSEDEFIDFMLLTIARQLKNTCVKSLRLNDKYYIRTFTRTINEQNFRD